MWRGPGAGVFVTGEAFATPFGREPYTTVPRPVLPILFLEAGAVRPRKSPRPRKMKLPKHLQHINPHAAGIDAGSRNFTKPWPEFTVQEAFDFIRREGVGACTGK